MVRAWSTMHMLCGTVGLHEVNIVEVLDHDGSRSLLAARYDVAVLVLQ